MSTFPISVYDGGEITYHSQIGANYTVPAKFTLGGNEGTTFEEVKIRYFSV